MRLGEHAERKRKGLSYYDAFVSMQSDLGIKEDQATSFIRELIASENEQEIEMFKALSNTSITWHELNGTHWNMRLVEGSTMRLSSAKGPFTYLIKKEGSNFILRKKTKKGL